ncbi:hypothetical protein [Methanosphaera sp.]|uniref:hypothetical protein n=1 Tax=Methanosphaera sp. TaxID=2666342 RepID=UPI0025FFBAD0|nr:hypothetical protein [Methanosphaera sp.]
MTKTIEELTENKQLLLNAIDILDTITEEENEGIKRTDEDFKCFETWSTTDVKNELQSKIGEIDVLIENLNKTTTEKETDEEEEEEEETTQEE